jgi:hypothetical protein
MGEQNIKGKAATNLYEPWLHSAKKRFLLLNHGLRIRS